MDKEVIFSAPSFGPDLFLVFSSFLLLFFFFLFFLFFLFPFLLLVFSAP